MSNLLEGTIDLNNLFNLNYNFDLLKGVLETIMKNQKGLNGKISEMEERDTAKDARINQLERELAGLKVNIRSGNGSNEMNTNVANYNTGGKSESSNRIGEEVTNKNDDAHILVR